jgi:hypothetical protein
MSNTSISPHIAGLRLRPHCSSRALTCAHFGAGFFRGCYSPALTNRVA